MHFRTVLCEKMLYVSALGLFEARHNQECFIESNLPIRPSSSAHKT